MIIYLDTNHISFLARYSEHADAQALLQALARHEGRIALSLIHVIELSNPRFDSRATVGSFLDTVPVVWALSPDDLWEAEVRRAFSVYARSDSFRVSAFGRDPCVAIGGRPSGANPSAVLRSFEDDTIRDEIDQLTVSGLFFDQLKGDATLIRDPLKLLRRMILERGPKHTGAGIVFPTNPNPDDIIRAVGGLIGFPSYAIMHSVATARLRDRRFKAKRSDVFDLHHAAYAPYAELTALDRSYASRVRSAAARLASRVTHRLTEVTSRLLGLKPLEN